MGKATNKKIRTFYKNYFGFGANKSATVLPAPVTLREGGPGAFGHAAGSRGGDDAIRSAIFKHAQNSCSWIVCPALFLLFSIAAGW